MILRGIAVSPGIAIGPARVWREMLVAAEDGSGPIDDVKGECARLLAVVDQVEEDLKYLQTRAAELAGPEEAAIFEAQRVMLRDPSFLDDALARIARDRLTAAAAVHQVAAAVAGALEQLENERFRARAADVRDVAARILRNLTGQESPTMPGPGVLVARDVAPSDLVALGCERVLGLAMDGGAPTAHAVILARAMGVPTVVGLRAATELVADDTTVVVDGDRGEVVIDPAPSTLDEYRRAQGVERARRVRAEEQRDAPARTQDGRRIEVAANAGSVRDVAEAVAMGADGIGLFRTEFLYLGRPTIPDEEEQFAVFREALDLLKGRPLIIRTVDIGADKPVPALPLPAEANPALGWRGIRLVLSRPDLLVPQLKAALRAAAHGPVKVMFPMVATPEEVDQVHEILADIRRRLDAEGWSQGPVEVGVMIEVPSAALLAKEIAERVDFMSLGTNDLVQYVFAADRTNDRLVHLSDAVHPALLRLIAPVIAAAHARGCWVGVCGEMAGDPQAVVLLVGLGVDELSMVSSAIPIVKAVIRRLSMEEMAEAARRALQAHTARAARGIAAELLGEFWRSSC